MHSCVIRTGSEQRISLVKRHFPHCQLVIADVSYQGNEPERFVGKSAKVQIEPTDFLVVTAEDDVISIRMNVKTGDERRVRIQSLLETLFSQIVNSHV